MDHTGIDLRKREHNRKHVDHFSSFSILLSLGEIMNHSATRIRGEPSKRYPLGHLMNE